MLKNTIVRFIFLSVSISQVALASPKGSDIEDHSQLSVEVNALVLAANNAYHCGGDGFSTPSGKVWFSGGNDNILGYRANLYVNDETKTQIVAYRGTDNWNDLLIKDVQIVFGNFNDVQRAGIRLLESLTAARPQYKIAVTGHSMGGVMAQAVAGGLNVAGAAFNTFASHELRHKHHQVEFYVHNTNFTCQNNNKDAYLGKLVKHRGYSHCIKNLCEKHFLNNKCSNGGCQADEPHNDLGYQLEKGVHKALALGANIAGGVAESSNHAKNGHVDQAALTLARTGVQTASSMADHTASALKDTAKNVSKVFKKIGKPKW